MTEYIVFEDVKISKAIKCIVQAESKEKAKEEFEKEYPNKEAGRIETPKEYVEDTHRDVQSLY